MPSRFPIRFERWYAALSSALGLRPSDSYLEIGDEDVECRMAWAFRARFPRQAVAGVALFAGRPLSRGVHGFGGRWLVNGAGDCILQIDLAPAQRARVLGVPVRLRQLLVSVDEPDRVVVLLRCTS